MHEVWRDDLRALLRRVSEVRGLSDRSEAPTALAPGDGEALMHTLRELADDLERSHRRLIEANIQLVSLREVASSLVGRLDHGDTTKTVTRYLTRAFAFDDAFLLLLDRENARLTGTWTHRSGDHEHSDVLEIPLLGGQGALARSLWLNRTVVQRAPRHHVPAALPHGHPLQDVFHEIGHLICVPLQRSHPVAPATEAHELCGARCILGDAALFAPPPPPDDQGWTAEREERQHHCLRCDLMPVLGVIGMARRVAVAPDDGRDVALLESIALSVAPVVENARLFEELRRSQRFGEHVRDSMTSALVAVNMKGDVLSFNRAAEELLGFTEAEAMGQPFGALFGPDADALVRAALEHGRTVRREETVLRARDGAPTPVSFTTSLLREDRRSVYGVVATFVDLAPIKRAEEEARRLDRLAALGRFTSSVAHEIRNPLAGIGAGVQYLERSMPFQDPQRENLDFIQNEIRRLDRILQDLFDITHPRGLRLDPAPLVDTVKRAVQCVQGLADERGVVLRQAVAPRTPAVPHDADQMEQVFINLVKNAIENSPAGGTVQVSIERAGPPRAAGRQERLRTLIPAVRVRVEDQGTGIAPENLKRVFEPFFTTKPKGSGLGLYISHDIVKRHGGAVTIQSEEGRGTTITVELPLEPSGGNP
ncbi:MAG: PAS domain-containing protein [Candidatus Eisenbacteria bacterium]|uniref:histidine kinase n=1 Tax=Eiseniibacteriota bacterium TaxID=2212470 RepID=A0A538SN94_UNCEI|nr:MAG: PAS domain-containing protein [Candidatus Eisenbacteria bacterium]